MKRVATWSVLVLAVLALALAPAVFAQSEKSQAAGSTMAIGAWVFGIPDELHTGVTGNEAIVVESGKVKAIQPMPGVKGYQQMQFVTDQGNSYTVFMGPKWFMDNQKVKFKAGDKVDVRGKKLGASIIATEIGKGDLYMKLRNEEDGVPTWECCFPGKVKQ